MLTHHSLAGNTFRHDSSGIARSAAPRTDDLYTLRSAGKWVEKMLDGQFVMGIAFRRWTDWRC